MNAPEAAARLATLQERQQELMGALSQSLAIRSLRPDAFDHGSCKSCFVGNLNNPGTMVFRITDGSGLGLEYVLSEVPDALFLPWALKLDNPPPVFARYIKRRQAEGAPS